MPPTFDFDNPAERELANELDAVAGPWEVVAVLNVNGRTAAASLNAAEPMTASTIREAQAVAESLVVDDRLPFEPGELIGVSGPGAMLNDPAVPPGRYPVALGIRSRRANPETGARVIAILFDRPVAPLN